MPRIDKDIFQQFLNDLIAGLRELEQNCESAIRDNRLTIVKKYTEKLVNDILLRWRESLPLKSLTDELYGLNLLFDGRTGLVLLPAAFIRGFTNYKSIVKRLQNFSLELQSSETLTWQEFQYKISDSILTYADSGLTRKTVDYIRFLTRVFLDYPNFWWIESFKHFQTHFKNYLAIYDDTINYNHLMRKYRIYIRNHLHSNSIARPIPWNISTLLITPQIDVPNDEEFPSSPICVIPELINKKQIPKFAFHYIPPQLISKTNPLYKGLVERLLLFLNLNHFAPKGSSKTLHWNLCSIFDLYDRYVDQSYELIDTFNLKDIKNKSLYDPVIAPNWFCELIYPQQYLKMDYLQDKFSYDFAEVKFKELIKKYNIRNIEKLHTFHKGLHKSILEGTNPEYRILFKNRLYLSRMPPLRQVLIWLPVETKANKQKLKRIIPFLSAWLPMGNIIEYKRGAFIYGFFPMKIPLDSLRNDLIDFFESFKIEVQLFEGEKDCLFTPFSIYYLPESYYFDETELKWNLPDRKLLPTVQEKDSIIGNVQKNEMKIFE
ncbi:MAG: hypothetical protein ACXAC7_12435 [Candidatus Hodarchaeales archaeon]|jgi:hypothetical protein